MRHQPTSPYDQITENSEFPRGRHQTCKLQTVRVGQKDVKVERVLWRAQKGEIPNTHTLYRTCDHIGCIEPDHHTLVPLKQSAAAFELQLRALEQRTQALEERLARLESACAGN